MSSVLDLTELSWVSQLDFAALSNTIELSSIEQEVYFAHRLKALLEKLPDRVFSDESMRDNLLTVAREYVNDMVEKEEAQ